MKRLIKSNYDTLPDKDELIVHTLRGDIQQIGSETDSTKREIYNYLYKQYVTQKGLPESIFISVLDQEYLKVKQYRERKTGI